jgi:hypothetical protein
MDTLFKAFYTTKADGMGIGLAISRTIIESHRGRLWATPNDGPGITLAFSIPRATNDEPTRLVTRSVLKTPTPAPRRNRSNLRPASSSSARKWRRACGRRCWLRCT